MKRILGALLAGGCAAEPVDTGVADTSPPAETGATDLDLAPDFTYPDATGAPVSLSDFRGHLVLLASAQMW